MGVCAIAERAAPSTEPLWLAQRSGNPALRKVLAAFGAWCEQAERWFERPQEGLLV